MQEAFPLCREPPAELGSLPQIYSHTAHMLLEVYTEPVHTVASGDYMATHNYKAIHGVLLRLGKEKESFTGSSFHLYFCFLWRYQDT